MLALLFLLLLLGLFEGKVCGVFIGSLVGFATVVFWQLICLGFVCLCVLGFLTQFLLFVFLFLPVNRSLTKAPLAFILSQECLVLL